MSFRVRKRWALGFAVAASVTLAVGAPGIAHSIINGVPDGANHPYVGLAVFDVDIPGTGAVPAWRCSGFLISPTVFVTAGHCTDGTVAARVWFDEDVEAVPDYPLGGITDHKGTPFTHPDYCLDCGKGKPWFSFQDAGVVVLDEPLSLPAYAQLPDPGVVGTLRNMTDLVIVGYGVQGQIHGGGPPSWGIAEKVRLAAQTELIAGRFSGSEDLMRTTQNPGQGKGGSCYGDSGGPFLLAETDTVLAIAVIANNFNCAGVNYSTRLDNPEILDWINGFLP
jgi:hypothetical protein